MVYHHVPYYMASRPRLSQQGLEAVTNNLAQGVQTPGWTWSIATVMTWCVMVHRSKRNWRQQPATSHAVFPLIINDPMGVSLEDLEAYQHGGCKGQELVPTHNACGVPRAVPERHGHQETSNRPTEYGQTLGHFPSTNPVGIVGDYITFISSYISIISPGYLVQYLSIPYYFCGECRKCHSFWTNFWLSKCRAGLATVVAVCLLAWGICHNAFVSWPWKGSGQVEPLWFVQRPYCGWCS